MKRILFLLVGFMGEELAFGADADPQQSTNPQTSAPYATPVIPQPAPPPDTGAAMPAPLPNPLVSATENQPAPTIAPPPPENTAPPANPGITAPHTPKGDRPMAKKAPPPEEENKFYKKYRECIEKNDASIQEKCAATPAADAAACLKGAKTATCGTPPPYDEVTLEVYNRCYRDNEKKIAKGCENLDPNGTALCTSAHSLHYCGQPDTGLLVQGWKVLP